MSFKPAFARAAGSPPSGRLAGLSTLTVALALGLCRCGGSAATPPVRLPADERPVPAGRGPAFAVRPFGPAVARRATIDGLRCGRAHGPRYGVHLELYAHRLVMPVPSGIGIAPPQRRRGAYVLGGACSYPVRTYEPTGVVVIAATRTVHLMTLFAIWGEPLSKTRLASWHRPVLAYLDGRRWGSAPGAIALTKHAEIVLEVDGAVAPHPRYTFPPGL